VPIRVAFSFVGHRSILLFVGGHQPSILFSKGRQLPHASLVLVPSSSKMNAGCANARGIQIVS
jgi:hypothetical protein